MRTLRHLFLPIIIGLICGGCTCNNGDIGPWFGNWHLEEITADGITTTDYDGNMFWQFQNDVICMPVPGPYHSGVFHWGTWTEQDGLLILDYDHHRDNAPEETNNVFTPPAESHIPAGIITLTINRLSGGKLTLTYEAPEATYRYYLKKQ